MVAAGGATATAATMVVSEEISENGASLQQGNGSITGNFNISSVLVPGYRITGGSLEAAGYSTPQFTSQFLGYGTPFISSYWYVQSCCAPLDAVYQLNYQYYGTIVNSDNQQDTLTIAIGKNISSGVDPYNYYYDYGGTFLASTNWAYYYDGNGPSPFGGGEIYTYEEFQDYITPLYAGWWGNLSTSLPLTAANIGQLNSTDNLGFDAYASGGQLNLQNLTLTLDLTTVPEPSTWAMLLLGVAMIGAGLRMARRKNDIALTALT
jgi:hypothetical protein